MRDNPGPPLFVVVPTGSPSKQTLAPASAIAGLTVGPLSTIYVEPPAPVGRGNDATAERGNAALPCATLDKAIALAVAALPRASGFVLAPGTYAPPSAPIPPTLENGVIIASAGPSGAGATIIDGAGTGLPCVDLSGGSRKLWIVGTGIRLNSDPGVPAVKADGSTAPAGTYFTSGALVVSGVLTGGGAVQASYAGLLIMEQLEIIGSDPWLLEHVAQVFMGAGCFSPFLSANYFYDADAPNVPPIDQARWHVFNGTTILDGFITIGAQAGVLVSTGSQVGNIVTDINHPPSISAALPERFPTVQLAPGSTALEVKAGPGATEPFPDTAIALGIDFSGATLVNGFRVETGPTPGLVNRQQLKAIGTIVKNAGALNPCQAGPGFDLDAQGAVIPNLIDGLQTTGIGGDQATVIPPDFITKPQGCVAGGNVVNFPINLAPGSYAALVEADDPTTLPLAVSPALTGGNGCVAFVSVGAGNIRVRVAYVSP